MSERLNIKGMMMEPEPTPITAVPEVTPEDREAFRQYFNNRRGENMGDDQLFRHRVRDMTILGEDLELTQKELWIMDDCGDGSREV